MIDLKKRTKCCGYSKPKRWLTSVMVIVSDCNSSLDFARTRSLMISLAVRPVSVLIKVPK